MPRLESYFLVAEFANAEPMLKATRDLREAGWNVELHTPFPVKGMKEALGFKGRTVPHSFVIGGVIGALTGFSIQVFANLAFPLDIGGRPLIAVPAFVMITFELMVLFSVCTGIGTMFTRNRLPRLNYPLFDAKRFHLASDNRFFVSLVLADRVDEREARDALWRQGPVSIELVGGEVME